MATYSKTSNRFPVDLLVKFTIITLGLLAGGVAALVVLWLWLDFQLNYNESYLAFISSLLHGTIPGPLQDFFAEQAQLMSLPLAEKTSAYWYMARIGGIISYLLLWLSTVWGLVLSTKIVSKVISPAVVYGLHEFLAILTLCFVMLHSFILMGDQYVRFNIFQILIPFTATYEPLWTGLGITAFYLSAAMTFSFYIRKQIGQKVWRTLHYLTFIAYALALVHGLMAGTDSSLLMMKLMYLGTGASVLFLVFFRLLTLKVRKKTHRDETEIMYLNPSIFK